MFTKIFDPDPQRTNLFTNVTKLERFVDQEVRVSSKFDKSDKSWTNHRQTLSGKVKTSEGHKSACSKNKFRGNDLVNSEENSVATMWGPR